MYIAVVRVSIYIDSRTQCVQYIGCKIYIYMCVCVCVCSGTGSSVGIVTDYGLDGPGSNPGGD